MRVVDGDTVQIEGVSMDVIHTPGHTGDSSRFRMQDRLFTGDALLIRATGGTDFQNGDPRAQYESLFGRLLRFRDETLVYPAHDDKGDTVSTIGEERAFNPRLQVKSRGEYVALMNSLKLGNPKMMNVAVPANLRQGLHQDDVARRGWAFSAREATELVERKDVVPIDLRKQAERERQGSLPGSPHVPYRELQESIRADGLLHELAKTTGKRLLFYCAFGERSAMAVRAAQDAGIVTSRHLQGGIDAWKKIGAALA